MQSRILRGINRFIQASKDKKYLGTLNNSEVELIDSIKAKKLTYLSDRKLVSIVESCNELVRKDIPGIYIEAGCALGGSSILISKLKKKERAFNIYDVFGMIPPPTEEDTPDVHERYSVISDGKSTGIDGDEYYGYEKDLYEKVKMNLRSFSIDLEAESIHLIKGLLQETMNLDQPVAFAHIDVDWYDPVKYSLEEIWPRLSTGGCIILDDYNDWGGCRKAADEFLKGVEEKYKLNDKMTSLKIVKLD